MNTRTALQFVHRNIVPISLAVRLATLTIVPTAVLVADTASAQAPTTLPEINLTLAPLSPEQFTAQTNVQRVSFGLKELSYSPELSEIAQAKLMDMKEFGYWDHFRPSDGKAAWDFMKEGSYNYRFAGENLARGFRTIAGITNAWMESPTHRANILSANYTEVGFAAAYLPDQEGKEQLVTVQLFGQR